MTRLFFIAIAFLMASTTCKAETELSKFEHIDQVLYILGAYLGQLAGGWAFTPKDGGAQLTFNQQF